MMNTSANRGFRLAARAYDNLSPEDLDPDHKFHEFKEWREDDILERVQAQLDRTGHLGELILDLYRAGEYASDKDLADIVRSFHRTLYKEVDKVARRLMG